MASARPILALLGLTAASVAFAAACAQPAPTTPTATTAAATPAAAATAPAGTTPAAAATAPAATTPAAAKPQAPSGSVIFANSQLPPNGDPYSSIGTTSSFVFLTYSETLLRLDSESKLAPGVATAWRQINPTTYQFTLRENMRFHNGEPLDAAAIKWALDRITNAENNLPLRPRFATVASSEVVDPRTINITTTAVDLLLPRRMIELFTIPPAYFQQVGAQAFGERPIGSGPFEVVNFDRESVTVRALDSHPRATPKVREITFRQLPEESTRMAALQAGDVQIAYALNPDSIIALDRGRFDIVADPVSQYRALMMRTPTGEPLTDLRVRQAIAASIDQRGVASVATAGLGEAATQLANPGVFGYNPDLRLYEVNPARARALLAEAGFPNGFSIPFNYRRQFSGDGETAQAVDGMLRAVGITPDLQELENALFSQRFSGGQLAPLSVMGIGTTPLLDADISYQWYRTDANSRFFSDPEYDRAFAASRAEQDPARREQLLREVAKIAYDKVAFVPLYTAINPTGVVRNVTGFAIRLDGRADFENVAVGTR